MATDRTPSPVVGYDDVACVIEEMQREGIRDPGILRIRTALGRGSTSRITKLKAQYMANQAGKMPASPNRANNPLAAAADALWDELMEALEAQEREMVQRVEKHLREAQAEVVTQREEKDKALEFLRQLRKEADEGARELAERERQVQELKDELTTAQKQIDQERHQNVLTEERLKSALDRLEVERQSRAALQEDQAQQVERLREDARRLEDRLSDALRREKELQFREQTLQAQNTELINSRERLQDDTKALQAAAAKAEQLASERQGQLAALAEERQRLWDRLAELEDQRVLDHKKLSALERQVESQGRRKTRGGR